MEQTPACGSNNETYATPCALHEEAMKLRNLSSLWLQHLGPCQSRPWILSTLEDVVSPSGQRVALNCEAKGFPVPDIFWEFHSADGRRVLKLPGTANSPVTFLRDANRWPLLDAIVPDARVARTRGVWSKCNFPRRYVNTLA